LYYIVTDNSEVFTKPETCSKLKVEELEGLGKLLSGLVSGFNRGMSKAHGTGF
jgi:hypothetical protein